MNKAKNISVRMNEVEYRAIKAKAEAANTSLSRYLIETILGARENDLRLRQRGEARLLWRRSAEEKRPGNDVV